MLHISIWGIEALSGVLSGDGTGILAPLCQRGATLIGGYGVRLIRLCTLVPTKTSIVCLWCIRTHPEPSADSGWETLFYTNPLV